jgi:branched-subunit amino acid transport protein AzlD
MINVIVWIVVVCALAWLAFWVLGQFTPPDPIGRVAKVVIVVVAVLIILGLAGSLFGVDLGLPTPVS